MGISPNELNILLITRGTFLELMDVSGLWDLNKKKVEELLYLLVFVWSPRSEV